MNHDTFLAFQRIERRLDLILARLSALTNLEVATVAKIDDLELEVAKVATVTDSAVALINGIAQQLRDAGSTDPRIQAVIASLDDKANALAAAVAANTPAAPAPTEPVEPPTA